MLSKVALLAAAKAISSPVLADNPSKPTPTIAKASASKSLPNKPSKTLTRFGGTANSGTIGTANGGVIGALQMATLKNAKANNADQRKEAQAARGGTRGGDTVPVNLTAIPPNK